MPKTTRGYLCLVLHAHLPFVRHPEHEHFLEENWLFEAISETYLPLLRVFNRLRSDGKKFRLTLSISPTLSSMLTDELLQQRYILHLERTLELADKELVRTAEDDRFRPVTEMYRDLFHQNLIDFTELYKQNILKGFRALEKEGFLEIITTSATHCFLPLYQEYKKSIEVQIQSAVISHTRNFGKVPCGFWLPECGYYPGLEEHLKWFNFKYFFTAAHGILFADKHPPHGVYAPLQCPNGIHAFGRDIPSSQAVWSAEEGYPGDASYRDFYRDIGYDLPLEYIGPYVHEGGIRIFTGFKYYAVTGDTDKKRPYNLNEAAMKVEEHADNFIYNRLKQVSKLERLMGDRRPLIICPYDAELFGHWWFEGPRWIEAVLRRVAELDGEFLTITPSDYLEIYPENTVGAPSFSSWGNKGYAEVWLDGSNDWIYRHIHKAIERMQELAERYPNESGLKERVLNQAAREVLLCQASDWPFIMKTGTFVSYARKRVREHLFNFNKIYDNLCRNTVDTEWLTRIEKKNNIFPDLDYRSFKL